MECSQDGKPGWKFGDAGHCYTHDGSEAGSAAAKRQAVKQALAIGGGKAPKDLSEDDFDAFSDEEVDLIASFADGPTLPDGVGRCAMNGTAGFKGMGGPNSACHVHDGTPDSMRSAIAKALRDRGTANGPPRNNADRQLAELETIDMVGVPLMTTGGPFFGQGSPDGGDFFDASNLQAIADQTKAVADELRIPIKLGHQRGQKLLKNSGLFADEQPAAGWIDPRTLRVAGGQLLGDIRRVPKKLSELMKVGAFRTRSVELSRIRSQKQGGKEYDSVMTGLALLGAKLPAIRTLDDIVALYADAEPESRFEDGTEATVTTYVVYTAAEDTSAMSDTANTAPGALTDEQIESFASAFGIQEDDAEKRRAAVLSKFAEHAPKSETVEPSPTPQPAPPNPTPPPEPSDPGNGASTSLSDAELADLRAKAERGDRAYADAARSRREATVNLAVRQGRIRPADRDRWVAFAEKDEAFAFEQLLAMPISSSQTTTFGSDVEGTEGVNDLEEKLYAQFAGMTGVRRAVTTGGNGQ